MSEWSNYSWPRRLWSASIYWDICIGFGIVCWYHVPILPVLFIRHFKVWIGPPSKGRIRFSLLRE